MAKKHGARQQKKLAKHKAKRVQKRAILDRTSSKDPTWDRATGQLRF